MGLSFYQPVASFFCMCYPVLFFKGYLEKIFWHTTNGIYMLGYFRIVFYLIIRWHYISEITGNYESAAFLSGAYSTLLRNYALLFLRSFLPPFINNKILPGCFIVIAAVVAFLFLRLQQHDRKKILIFFL